MDNEKELVRFILQYLLDNHFESKSDMARQLDIRHRTMQRVFEQLHNDKAKGSTIVLDRALLFCAKRKISVDQLFREYQDFHQGAMLEPTPHEEDIETMPSAHDLCLPDIESLCNKAIIYDRFRFLHPITKRKGYSQNESPNDKTKALAIILLCTHRGEWVHFLHSIFQCEFVPGVAAKELCWDYSYSRVHLPFCISILKEYKEKD